MQGNDCRTEVRPQLLALTTGPLIQDSPKLLRMGSFRLYADCCILLTRFSYREEKCSVTSLTDTDEPATVEPRSSAVKETFQGLHALGLKKCGKQTITQLSSKYG